MERILALAGIFLLPLLNPLIVWIALGKLVLPELVIGWAVVSECILIIGAILESREQNIMEDTREAEVSKLENVRTITAEVFETKIIEISVEKLRKLGESYLEATVRLGKRFLVQGSKQTRRHS